MRSDSRGPRSSSTTRIVSRVRSVISALREGPPRAVNRKLHAQCASNRQSRRQLPEPPRETSRRERRQDRIGLRPCPFSDAGRGRHPVSTRQRRFRSRAEARIALASIRSAVSKPSPKRANALSSGSRSGRGLRAIAIAARSSSERASWSRAIASACASARLPSPRRGRAAAAAGRARGGPPRAARSRRECSRAAPLRARRRSRRRASPRARAPARAGGG